MHDEDELDSLIDRALVSYGGAHDAGNFLENRILAQVREEMASTPVPSRKRWLPWVVGLAAAACLLALIFSSLWPKHAPTYAPANTNAHDTAKIQSPKAAKPMSADQSPREQLRVATHIRPKQEVQQAAALPKLDVFPAPEPASHEVREFAAMVQRLPTSKTNALLEAEAKAGALMPAAPIAIDELKIQPLEPLDEGGR